MSKAGTVGECGIAEGREPVRQDHIGETHAGLKGGGTDLRHSFGNFDLQKRGAIHKGLRSDRGKTRRQVHLGQAGAGFEEAIWNLCEGPAERCLAQAGAAAKGHGAELDDMVGDRHLAEAGADLESRSADVSEGVREKDFDQAVTREKSLAADRGDRIAEDRVGEAGAVMKAIAPIVVTPLGTAMNGSFSQVANAPSSRMETELGIVTLVSSELAPKANLPIEVTPSEMLMLPSREPKKAFGPMAATPGGVESAPVFPGGQRTTVFRSAVSRKPS